MPIDRIGDLRLATRPLRGACALATAALLLAACGGETAAVLGVIGAAGGDFSVDSNGDGRIDGSDDGRRINLQVDVDANGNPWQVYYTPEYSVKSSAESDLGAGGCANLVGWVRRDRIDLGSCFQGRFADGSVNKVVSDNGATVLYFGTFNPSLATGVWTDIDDPARRIRFRDDSTQDPTDANRLVQTGCELRDGALTGSQVSLVRQAADLSQGIYDDVVSLTVGTSAWTAGRYVGISGIEVSGAPGTLKLQRERDPGGLPACP